MQKRLWFAGCAALAGAVISSTTLADINRVRVVNDTSATVYIHKGGFAPSTKIPAGQWKIFYYPFYVIPPGSKKRVASSLLVATSGGKWVTSPNGLTTLSRPKMVICLDYKSQEHAHKTGNRVWTIKRAEGFDKNCQVRGYKQPWHKK